MAASDAELGVTLRQARDGDEDGLRVLYRSVRPGLLRYLRVLVPDDAEDITSETWLQVARPRLVHSEAALTLVARLPRDRAQAVLLRVVFGYDANTAAQVLGKRAGAVRTAAYRRLNKLNDILRSM